LKFFFFLIKEFYIVESGYSTDDAIEIIDKKRGRIYVKEIEQEPEQSLFFV
jgi:hypothetical protein